MRENHRGLRLRHAEAEGDRFQVIDLQDADAEVAKAHAARSPRYPKAMHYRGDGVFMESGRNVSMRRHFKPENL